MAKALFDIALESTLETVKLWRKGGIDTIEELNRKVERKISKAFAGDELCGRIEDELHDWLDELMRNLENELTTLCVRCGVPPERMSLTGAKVDAGLDGVKLSLLDAMGMDILSGLMGVVLAVVGASLCGAAAWRWSARDRLAWSRARRRHTAGAGRQERHGKGAGQGEAAAAGAQAGDG
ncbi:MAG: hypothetical protein ACLUI3_06045 [Christensenellales bacterium]